MAKNKKKTLILNTLILLFCILIIALYSLIPLKGSEEIKKFLLTFDSDGGTSVAAIEIRECEVVAQPPNPTKEGYIFKGWMLGSQPYDFKEGICGDLELKALWEEMSPDKTYITYYIQYTEDGDEVPFQVAEGEIPTKPEDPTRAGYIFTGWYLNNEVYNFDTPLQNGDLIVAGWEEEYVEPEPGDDTEYTVTFNANGGALSGSCDDQIVKSGGTAATGCSATRDDYSFVGWNTNKNAKSAQNLRNVKITKNTTFYAIWKANGQSGGDTPSNPDTPTPPPVTTYTLSCKVAGSQTYSGTTTDNSTSAAATECNKHQSSSYPTGLYNVNYSCSVSGTSITCNATPSKKSFKLTATIISDGTTIGGYTFTVANVPSGYSVKSITIVQSGGRSSTQTAENNSAVFNNQNFYDKFGSATCVISVNGSDETFNLTKGW